MQLQNSLTNRVTDVSGGEYNVIDKLVPETPSMVAQIGYSDALTWSPTPDPNMRRSVSDAT